MKKLTLNVISRFIVVLMMLVNIKIYTSFLNKSDLGIYFFLITVSYSANALIFVPLDYYQQSNLLKNLEDFGLGGIKKFIKLIILNIFIISLFIIIFLYLFLNKFILDFLICAILSISIYLSQTLRNTLNNLNNNNIVSYNFIIESIVKVLIFFCILFFYTQSKSKTINTIINCWTISFNSSFILLFK